jgi:hypothetical protein
MSDYLLGMEATGPGCQRFMVWIDQVGSFLVYMAECVTIGGPAAEGHVSDITLLANLSRRHATFVRGAERYVLHAHANVQVGARAVHDRVDLGDGCDILLGNSVRLRFRLPSAMSGSARIEFSSDHRPAQLADGVVLMDQTCLLGPGDENHIRCPQSAQTVVLYRQDGALACKSRGTLFLDGRHAPEGGSIGPGSVVTGSDLRFRIEEV